jgi:hypothetical protein
VRDLRDPGSDLPIASEPLPPSLRYVTFQITITNQSSQAQPFNLIDLRIKASDGTDPQYTGIPAVGIKEKSWLAGESHTSTVWIPVPSGVTCSRPIRSPDRPPVVNVRL